MTIATLGQKGKELLARIPTQALYTLILVLVASLSFGLGMLAGEDMGAGKGIWIEERPLTAKPAGFALYSAGVASSGIQGPKPGEPLAPGGQYVASKSGERYYLPTCGGVSRIKEENKIWFPSKEAAEAAGYTPAKNCKGL